ncbi:MAG: hypothetical protein ACOX5G_06960 [Kiritimatiellia bacterium]|jgi:hypothetical protein
MNAKNILALAFASLFATAATAAPLGVTVNNVMLDSDGSSGTGWAYEPATSNLVLCGAGPFTLCGMNEEGAVRIVVPADTVNTITLTNLTLVATNGDQCAFALEPNADVSLFLAGENALASGGNRAGLEVPSEASLAIANAPAADDGALTATGGYEGAGIGGGNESAGGAITICGGNVTAMGGEYFAAGIGGGAGGGGGAVTISNGTVTAIGGVGGAGIGTGGYAGWSTGADGGTVEISGGTVTASGGDFAAGIGGGDGDAGGGVTVSGGQVFAFGGKYGAGIGGGNNDGNPDGIAGSGGTVAISGGRVTAIGGLCAAGIGGGTGQQVDGGDGATLAVSGGTVFATGGAGGAPGVGGGLGNVGEGETGDAPAISGTSLFTGGSIRIRGGYAAAVPSNGMERVSCVGLAGFPMNYKVEITDLPGYGVNDIVADELGGIYLWLPDGRHDFMASRDPYTVEIQDGAVLTGVTANGREVAFGPADPESDGWTFDAETHTLTLLGTNPVTLSGSNEVGGVCVFMPGYTTNTVTLSNLTLDSQWRHSSACAMQSYAVATIFLEGTNRLESGSYRAGLEVAISARLSITNAPGDDAAALTALGGAYGAGIGSAHRQNAGIMRFFGGTVTARGYSDAAGVGGAGTDNRAESNGGRGGTVYIYGGTLDATGSGYSAGIGSGYRRAVGLVAIWGGTVTATGGDNGGPGIGGGAGESNRLGSYGGNMYIYGGHVTATGGYNGGAGIGGGCYSPCDPLTITGGTVLAAGGSGSWDIGRGRNYANPSYIPIFTGGSIRPISSYVSPTPKNNTATVACVVWPGFEPGAPVVFPDTDSGLPDTYGTNDIVADEAGCIYLWFPNASDKTYALVANGCTNTVEIRGGRGSSGVTVNGEDAAFGPTNSATAGWSNSSGNIRLSGPGPFTISGANASGNVRLVGVANAVNTVVLSNLTLGAGGYNRYAFLLESNANMALVLKGTNALWSGSGRAGMGVNAGRTLSITNAPGDEAATLVVTGGSGGAGIGGDRYYDAGTIAISGGRVLATAGTSGAAIGGGSDGSGGTVTIAGGTVTATSTAGGAGIGGGHDGDDGGTVVIAGGTVTATSRSGAGIGGGAGGSGGMTTISGGTVTATSADGGAGIGGGYYYGGSGGTITIVDGNVTATGGGGGAGIGGGYMGTAGQITITNGVVTATGRGAPEMNLGGGAGIGSGAHGDDFGSNDTVAIIGGQITATGGQGGAGVGCGYSGTLTPVEISGGTVTATGGASGGAGIGGGGGYTCADDTVTISGGTVTATGTGGGAGIGSGSGYYCPAGRVDISGGQVTATGSSGGAGIGGGAGFFCSGGSVGISGGTVVAQGSLQSQDIGAGRGHYDDYQFNEDDETDQMILIMLNYFSSLGTNIFTGGSIHLVNDMIGPAPRNGTERVWCVTVPGLAPNAPVEITLPAASLPAYFGVNDLFADETGRIYLWLPDGNHAFTAGGRDYTASVNGTAITADGGIDAPVFATDGTGFAFDGASFSIRITNAQSGVYYTLYATTALGGDWELVESLRAENDGDLTFTNLDATAPARFFKVVASTTQP